ncbi:MAG: four helix bundle protein [Candidatus Peribacteraceae bacterium]|jgi:four helix bundle protein
MSCTHHSYQDLVVWQRSIELVAAVYELTQDFPTEDHYGLAEQIKSTAVSIPSYIAKGRHRTNKHYYAHYLQTAYGCGMEMQKHITIAKCLPMLAAVDFQTVDSLLEEVMNTLSILTRALDPASRPFNTF